MKAKIPNFLFYRHVESLVSPVYLIIFVTWLCNHPNAHARNLKVTLIPLSSSLWRLVCCRLLYQWLTVNHACWSPCPWGVLILLSLVLARWLALVNGTLAEKCDLLEKELVWPEGWLTRIWTCGFWVAGRASRNGSG